MNGRICWQYGACIVAGLLIVAASLWFWGAAELRENPGEIVFLTFAGAVLLALVTRVFSWLGLSLTDDAADRRNDGALIALCGGVLSVSLIYAGGSLGEGPTVLENFFCAGIGTGVLLVLWAVLETGGGISRSICEERDAATGVRFCGLLLALGLILGRALAGDWHSASETIHDFAADGSPALALTAIALAVERLLRPTRSRPFRGWVSSGVLPGLIYLAIAGFWVWHLGKWEGMPPL